MSWQNERTMSPAAFKRAIQRLGMSENGAARFLGLSDSTVRRFVRGDFDVHTSVALLLNSMIEHNDWPIVPKRKRKSAPVDAHP